jgi:hypothetical protein
MTCAIGLSTINKPYQGYISNLSAVWSNGVIAAMIPNLSAARFH